jgi:hypothetical protein
MKHRRATPQLTPPTTAFVAPHRNVGSSLTLITAVLLLLIGIAAIVSMVFQVGPFD